MDGLGTINDVKSNSLSGHAQFGCITPAEIEIINAHGPFNHSVWRGRGITVSHEEGLAGRVEFLSSKVRETITKQFSNEQLSRMSIVDVGCYDGWLLESLQDLPFVRMVGIEPRRENIERGKRVREILHLTSRVQYRTGEIDTLDPHEQFDVVLCMGVIHHLESIHASLKKLRSICADLLVIDTLCLPSSHLTNELRRDVELKDVVYRYKAAIFGITAQKFEGNYYPGSGVNFSVVNIPTAESLKMHLDVLGFRAIAVVADWEQFRNALPHNHRPINEICLSALVASGQDSEQPITEIEWVKDYEVQMITKLLPKMLIVPLYRVVCENGLQSQLSGENLRIYQGLIEKKGLQTSAPADSVPSYQKDALLQEIVASFSYSPIDKIRLEYAKHLLECKEIRQAVSVLHEIVRRPNADWRSCYRSFYLLWRASLIANESLAAERYRQLCLTCNPNFPLSLFTVPPHFCRQNQ